MSDDLKQPSALKNVPSISSSGTVNTDDLAQAGLQRAYERGYQDACKESDPALSAALARNKKLEEALKDARWTLSTITPMKPKATMELCVKRIAEWDALLAVTMSEQGPGE